MRELKRFKNYFITENGCVYHKTKKGFHKLRPRYTRQGYTRVLIGGKDYYIHRLVVETFIGPIPQGMTVNHKNFIKDDNNVDNLEILSMLDNIKHYYENRKKKGEV